MVEHLVLFKLKAEATAADADAILEGLRGLPAAIDTIRELHCGRNFSPRGQGFDLALRVLFDDRAGLEVYGPHPAHQGLVAAVIKDRCDDVLVADFEC